MNQQCVSDSGGPSVILDPLLLEAVSLMTPEQRQAYVCRLREWANQLEVSLILSGHLRQAAPTPTPLDLN
jgi:hypothetical protein